MVKAYLADISSIPDSYFERSISTLPSPLKERALRCSSTAVKRQRAGGALLLTKVLRENGIELPVFSFGEHGKPKAEGIYFNISHSANLIALALSENEVGCDIELIRNAPFHIADRFFSPDEQKWIFSFSKEDTNRAFFRIWTAKESYMKYKGMGFSLPPSAFEIGLKNKNSPFIANDPECFFKEYCGEGFVLTICSCDNDFADSVSFIDL